MLEETIYLRLDTLKKSVRNVIQHRVVVDDGKVLSLGLELLVGVLARSTHGIGHLLSLHLLRNLAGS